MEPITVDFIIIESCLSTTQQLLRLRRFVHEPSLESTWMNQSSSQSQVCICHIGYDLVSGLRFTSLRDAVATQCVSSTPIPSFPRNSASVCVIGTLPYTCDPPCKLLVFGTHGDWRIRKTYRKALVIVARAKQIFLFQSIQLGCKLNQGCRFMDRTFVRSRRFVLPLYPSSDVYGGLSWVERQRVTLPPCIELWLWR